MRHIHQQLPLNTVIYCNTVYVTTWIQDDASWKERHHAPSRGPLGPVLGWGTLAGPCGCRSWVRTCSELCSSGSVLTAFGCRARWCSLSPLEGCAGHSQGFMNPWIWSAAPADSRSRSIFRLPARWAFGFSGYHQQNINVYWFTDVVSLFVYAVDCFLLGIKLLLLLLLLLLRCPFSAVRQKPFMCNDLREVVYVNIPYTPCNLRVLQFTIT